MLNTAYDLKAWASCLTREDAITLYASTLKDGLFNDKVLDEIVPRDSEAIVRTADERVTTTRLETAIEIEL